MEQQAQRQFGYQTMQLIKTEQLGKGSYGAVYKAMYDDLPCAGKILHPTLFQFNDPGEKHTMERFQQECSFLSAIRHPNIIQYLGVHNDPDTNLPVLLMELMEDNLTNFLDLSQEPLPCHTQMNLGHDIALALAYLHSNDIIHRDLSSNNVLLIGAGNRAKVTDFGMAKLFEPMTPLTKCPGAELYMSPEAFDDQPVYTTKLDTFSFGVLNIQIITRKLPQPAPRIRKIRDPQNHPRHKLQEVVPETERRKSHIDLIDPNHPLLRIAILCLSDNEEDRPSARQLCHHLAALKEEASQYRESVQQAQEERQTNTKCNSAGRQEIQQLRQKQFRELNQQLAASEQEVAQLEQNMQSGDKANQKLQEVNPHSQSKQVLQQPLVTQKEKLKLNWKKCNPAPCQMFRGSATEFGSMAYFRPDSSSKVHSYNSDTEKWSTLPECHREYFTLAVINGLVTVVGGRQSQSKFTNNLLSLVPSEGGKWKWVEHFPPMPTKRVFTAVVCSGMVLVVAGGWGEGNTRLATVEVMNTDTRQWSTASNLPHPLYYATATVCGDRVYVAGGWDQEKDTKSVFTCSLSALLQPQTTAVWHPIESLQVEYSTCVALNGQMLAVGGYDSDKKDTKNIYSYNTDNNSWEAISQMLTARRWCLVAVLPGKKVMVVGGEIKELSKCVDNVEIATVQ